MSIMKFLPRGPKRYAVIVATAFAVGLLALMVFDPAFRSAEFIRLLTFVLSVAL